jgi:hypothetical protein
MTEGDLLLRGKKLFGGLPMRAGLPLSLAFLLFGFGTVSSAFALQTHGFEPLLSLTGTCTTSTVDPVADPGCPGGTHPSSEVSNPQAVTTDSSGIIYVVSYGSTSVEGAQGRIDVFDSSGFYITSISAPGGPQFVAVDGKGTLYVSYWRPGATKLERFSPTVYVPSAGEIQYGNPPVLIDEPESSKTALAINPLNDHLLAYYNRRIVEFSSAMEGNSVLDGTIGEGALVDSVSGRSLALDATHGLLYAYDQTAEGDGVIRVFELSAPHDLVRTLDGSATLAGVFGEFPSVAVDEGSGHVFIYDGGGEGSQKVYELTEGGEYVSRIDYGIKDIGGPIGIRVDNGANSPNGALNPEGRYLFVPSHPTGIGHVFAYAPLSIGPAEVLSASAAQVSRTDAELRATIEPGGAATTYTFEYTTQERFEAEGFIGAEVAGSGQIPAEGSQIAVTAPATGLSPQTAYRFRVVAGNEVNELNPDEAEGTFTTYPAATGSPPCPNDALRTGLSAPLPDCRAYELVTPADTNARSPFGLGHLGIYFSTRESSPAGDKVSFQIEGGVIPGAEGTGNINGDPYLATRGPGGWTSASAGPSGTEAALVVPGSPSPDQGYSFWGTGVQGSAVIGGQETYYVRYPDGRSKLVGRGSLNTDPRAEGKLISEAGGHIVFSTGRTGFSPVNLEPNAPPSGTKAIYDRTADEVTHVVSLLPGDVTPAAGQNADYRGASLDGKGVAFTIGSKLYLRYDNEETYEVGDGVTFAGVAGGGNRAFYLEGGKLIRFDALTGNRTDFNSTGTAVPVNVSADGSAAYLVSTTVLTTTANPLGDKAKAGQQNLYLSKEGTISFVGIVTERDVKGDTSSESSGGEVTEGLGLWVSAIDLTAFGPPGRLGIDPSRTTPDGNAIVFESRADLTGYDSDGHAQVYRYDSADGELQCLSCIPTGAVPTGDASLQSLSQERGDPEPLNSYAWVRNLRADGRRAFFQSTEALVPEDTDGLQDIYEWEEHGVGSCTLPQGCVHLISSGHSERADYLYAVSDIGDDVFFRTSDLLLPADADETPSIYDARVGGGFSESAGAPCPATQACPNPLSPAPIFNTPGSRNTGSAKTPPKPCPKGKRKVKRHGKVRCVKKHHKQKHRKHKAGTKKGAGK